MKENVYSAVVHILDGYLEMNNHRKTPERYAILKAVYEMSGHFTLDELSDKLNEERFPVSRATLYNTLNLFMELRLVIRHHFEATTKYEACYDSDGHHCHQICTMCGKVTEMLSPQITEAVDNLRLQRFRKDGYTLYIYGVCSSCQAKMTRLRRVEKVKKQKQ